MPNFTQPEFDNLTIDDLLKNVFTIDSNGRVCMRVLMIGQNIINWGQIGGTITDQSDLNTALNTLTANANSRILSSAINASNGVAGLGADGKLSTSLLPSIVFNDVKVVADIAARDAISMTDRQGLIVKVADRGDGKPSNYMWDIETTAWIMFADVSDVTSVNGYTGVINLTIADIPNLQTNLDNRVWRTGNVAETITGLKTFSSGQIVITQDGSNNATVRYTNGTQNWYVGLRGDTSHIWSVGNDTTQILKVYPDGAIGLGAAVFGDGARVAILGRTRTINGSGKRVSIFGPAGNSDRGSYYNFEAHHASDGSSIDWTFYADRDGAIVGTDAFQLWAYPKDTSGNVLAFTAPMQVAMNRANSTFAWTFAAGNITAGDFVSATDVRVTAGTGTAHTGGGRLCVGDRPFGSIVAQAGGSGTGKVFALIDNGWTRVPVQFSYDAPNNSLLVHTNGDVGINCVPAGYKLDVGGSLRLQGTGKLLTIGDDAALYDMNIANTLALKGEQNSNIGRLQLGASAYIQGNADGTLTLQGYTPPTPSNSALTTGMGVMNVASQANNSYGWTSTAVSIPNGGLVTLNSSYSYNGLYGTIQWSADGSTGWTNVGSISVANGYYSQCIVAIVKPGYTRAVCADTGYTYYKTLAVQIF